MSDGGQAVMVTEGTVLAVGTDESNEPVIITYDLT